MYGDVVLATHMLSPTVHAYCDTQARLTEAVLLHIHTNVQGAVPLPGEQNWPQVVCRPMCSHLWYQNYGSDSYLYDHFFREALQIELKTAPRMPSIYFSDTEYSINDLRIISSFSTGAWGKRTFTEISVSTARLNHMWRSGT
jgi:hypothetical protein